MPVTYDNIATTTLGSTASSITFSSIASSWTDLRVIFVVQNSTSQTLNFRFNNDSASNYSYTQLGGDGSSPYSARSTSQAQIQIGYGSGMPTSPNWGLYTFDVFSYTASTYKTVLATMSVDKNGSGETNRNVGLWSSTSAITRIDLIANGGNFQIGTTATLYGIKNA
jgi:hypothetical protein